MTEYIYKTTTGETDKPYGKGEHLPPPQDGLPWELTNERISYGSHQEPVAICFWRVPRSEVKLKEQKEKIYKELLSLRIMVKSMATEALRDSKKFDLNKVMFGLEGLHDYILEDMGPALGIPKEDFE